jgi:hypothetical protein
MSPHRGEANNAFLLTPAEYCAVVSAEPSADSCHDEVRHDARPGRTVESRDPRG